MELGNNHWKIYSRPTFVALSIHAALAHPKHSITIFKTPWKQIFGNKIDRCLYFLDFRHHRANIWAFVFTSIKLRSGGAREKHSCSHLSIKTFTRYAETIKLTRCIHRPRKQLFEEKKRHRRIVGNTSAVFLRPFYERVSFFWFFSYVGREGCARGSKGGCGCGFGRRGD